MFLFLLIHLFLLPLHLPQYALLKVGDMVKIDLGAHMDGYIVVAAHTVIVKEVPVPGKTHTHYCSTFLLFHVFFYSSSFSSSLVLLLFLSVYLFICAYSSPSSLSPLSFYSNCFFYQFLSPIPFTNSFLSPSCTSQIYCPSQYTAPYIYNFPHVTVIVYLYVCWRRCSSSRGRGTDRR